MNSPLSCTKLSIIVPVFNEALTVRKLLDLVWEKSIPGYEKELIVVESNSSDGSREIIKEFAREKAQDSTGVLRLILQDKPQGKGAALREGFQAATGDIILIQDADLEYSVDDYPSLLEPIERNRSKFVLGSRHLSDAGWKIRHFEDAMVKGWLLNLGGLFFHGFFNLVYQQRLTDPTTMYKVFKRSCLENLHFESNRFDFDFELLAKLIRAGYCPIEVPISYSSRGFKEGKKIRIFLDPLTWIRAIVKFRFSKLHISEAGASALLSLEKSKARVESENG